MMSSITPHILLSQMKEFIYKPIPYTDGKMICMITNIIMPNGPIKIKRHKISYGDKWSNDREESISVNMILRVINALNTRIPINIDRVLAGSYNTRSALEALISACPSFYMCNPTRVTQIGDTFVPNKAHKHIIWKPENEPHNLGEHSWLDPSESGYITEVPSQDIYSEIQIDFKNEVELQKDLPKDPEIQREHSEKQIFLCHTAEWMGCRSWVAVEDHGIKTNGKSIMELPNIVKDLNYEVSINNRPEAIRQAKHIDCIWFNGGMPFVFEVEHTTGVTSGLSRMQRLRDKAIGLKTDYVIVAPDHDRNDVFTKGKEEQFSDMDTWYLPYSSLAELRSFSLRHKFRLTNKERGNFLKMFMEQINSSNIN